MLGNLIDLRIGSKLILAFALLTIGFGSLLFATLTRFVALQEEEAALFKRSYARVSDVKELRLTISAQRNELLLALSDVTTGSLAEFEANILQRTVLADQAVKRLRAGLGETPEIGALLDQLETVRGGYNHTRDNEVLPLIREGRLDAARSLILGVQLERGKRIHALGQQLAELTDQRVAATLESSRQTLLAQREQVLVLGLLLVAGSGLLAWLLSRHIAQPLARLTALAERISRGEIPRDMRQEQRRDEVGRLAQAFNQMGQYLQALAAKAEYLAQGHLRQDSQPLSEQDVLGNAFAVMLGNLRNLVGELNEGIAVLASSSEEVLAATSQVASNTQETATAISEIVTTVDEVKQTAVLASGKAQSVADSTARTRQVAQGGRQAVEEALKGMEQIREQMQAVAESIMRLGEQSQAIGEIVASVNDLAEQSNLLGVNASIEAMRAGETGKGFSVVAQEVKALAEQSKQATAQVRGILGEIQKAMTKAVLLAEQGSKTVETGYERAQSSGEAIRALDGSIAESNEMALQIAATSQQQMVGMDQVANAMSSIREASQSNVSGTRQMDQATRNLHELGLKLQGLAAQFKL